MGKRPSNKVRKVPDPSPNLFPFLQYPNFIPRGTFKNRAPANSVTIEYSRKCTKKAAKPITITRQGAISYDCMALPVRRPTRRRCSRSHLTFINECNFYKFRLHFAKVTIIIIRLGKKVGRARHDAFGRLLHITHLE